MPLYEYHCLSCRKHFEVIQKFSDDPLTVHENCGGELEKVPSAPAFHFKGTGWYVTDYARKGSSAPKDSKPSGEKSPAVKTEPKTEPKTGSKNGSAAAPASPPK